MATTIDAFRGKYAFLSNFFFQPFVFERERYSSVEHGFQANKTLDLVARGTVRAAMTPDAAKKLGQLVTLRPDWEVIKLGLMEKLVTEKFRQNIFIRGLLLGTGDAVLIEGNSWKDTFWGVCKGVGQNHLGLILMRVRARTQAGPLVEWSDLAKSQEIK